MLPAEFSDHPAIKLSREAPAEHDYVSPAAACSTAALLAPVRSRAGLRPAHWPPVVVALGRSTAALLAPVRSRAGLRPAHWPPVVVALGRSTAALLAPVRSRAGLRPAHWPPAGLRWGCLGLVAPPCRWCWVSCPGDGLQSGRASRAVLGAPGAAEVFAGCVVVPAGWLGAGCVLLPHAAANIAKAIAKATRTARKLFFLFFEIMASPGSCALSSQVLQRCVGSA